MEPCRVITYDDLPSTVDLADRMPLTKEFDDTNRGVLFREEKKSEPADRDYSGSINIAGVEYWLSGWIKTSKNGRKYLSLSVKTKDTQPKPAARERSRADDLDDSVPF